MKVSILTEEFLRLMGMVGLIAGEGSATKESRKQAALNKAHNHVFLEAKDGVLTIRSIDYECHLASVYKPAKPEDLKISEEGSVMLPVDAVLGFARNTRAGSHMEITVGEGDKANLEWFSYEKKVTRLRDSDIESKVCDVDAAPIRLTLTQQMIRAMDRSGHRVDPEIQPNNKWPGVLFDMTQPGEVWISGFNPSMIYAHRIPLDHGHDCRFAIGARMIPLLLNISEGGDLEIGYVPDKAKLYVRGKRTNLIISLLNDTFKPGKYQDSLLMSGLSTGAFHTKPYVSITLDKEDFGTAVRQVAEVLSREDHTICFHLSGKSDDKHVVDISAKHRVNDNRSNTCLLVDTEGDIGPVKIGLHYGIINEMLRDIGSDRVTIHVLNASTPIVCTDPKDPTFAAVVILYRLE